MKSWLHWTSNFQIPFSMSEQFCSMGCWSLRDLQRKSGIDFLDVISSEDKNPDCLVLESYENQMAS